MSNGETKYLLIGYSVASWWCAHSIREGDRSGRIVAVTEEEGPYSRPLITYVLGKKTGDVAYTGTIFQHDEVEIYPRKRVVEIEPRDRIARLSDGTDIRFQKALIATGGIPIFPTIPGRENQGIFTFTRRSDMESIDTFLHGHPARNIVILGGGFIGLKTCEAMMDMKKNITLVELAPRLLQNMLDEEGSYYLEKALAHSGVHVIKEDTIVLFETETDRLTDVVLKSGRRIPADLAVVSIGVRPNVDFLRNSGIEVHRGIVVDEHQETSCPGLYAAGDVTETRNLLTGERNVVAVWPEAVNQGRIAGWNMTGREVAYEGSLPVNAVEVGEKAMVSAGIVNPPADGYETIVRKDRENYQKLVLKDDLIMGAVFVGEISKSGIYINLMRQKLPVETFRDKLLDPNFGLINLPTNYRKHIVKGVGIEV
ncbi:MAG: FAD-dependent oxidoreductase [Candidatus Atribacteria bacterium]|nr:FAD-dependent oxidoreductase [Candidatus Atribacteria bacterium]